ncbi:MAG: hypothetical protein BV456_10725 [Thermoplasmata archaeon M8B2D]|nr:MAG: hypothetical protein BV456_10725 [Thermoplasmata archaeon M8B2D]
MRQYVVPNKKIVCKILHISGTHVHLSLRRVTSKEKKEVMQKFNQERAIDVSMKQLLGEKEGDVKKKILKDFESLTDFAEEAKADKAVIEKYIPKAKQEAIRKIIEKKKRDLELNHIIKLKCLEEDGVKRIKKILDVKDDSTSVTYISAGQFKIKMIVKDFKEGKKKMQELLENLEKRAKENKCEFEAKEEKSK